VDQRVPLNDANGTIRPSRRITATTPRAGAEVDTGGEAVCGGEGSVACDPPRRADTEMERLNAHTAAAMPTRNAVTGRWESGIVSESPPVRPAAIRAGS
jgi:hypothetical protein